MPFIGVLSDAELRGLNMPHVNIKMFAGRSELEKQRLAKRVTLAIMNAVGASESSISVVVEEVEPENWSTSVFDPEISGKSKQVYKHPGYQRF